MDYSQVLDPNLCVKQNIKSLQTYALFEND
jgi:hypothetical protein